MGAPESRLVQFVSAIKSRDDVTVKVTWPNNDVASLTIRYDKQEFDKIVKTGDGQMLVQLNESQWPESLPWGWGVGTEFPEIEIEVTWKDKVCKFRHSCTRGYDLDAHIMPFPTYQYYIYEDGIHVGPEPIGIFWWKCKDKRRIIEWKLQD